MGSFIEINDTLQITTEQGFPEDILNYEKHQENPYTLEDVQEKIFEFKDKKDLRVYKAHPIRNFLVHNKDGKWYYWGLVHVLEVTHDNVNKMTSGKFQIIKLYTPEEMKQAQNIIDRNVH